MQRLVRLPSLLEERHRADDAHAGAPAAEPCAAEEEPAEEEEPGADGDADDEREVRADAVAEGGVGGRPGGVAADAEEVGVCFGGVVGRCEELNVWV